MANALRMRWGLWGKPTSATFALDSSSDKIGFRLMFPRALIPNQVSVYVAAVAGSPPTYALRIETDDGTGLPSGTLYDANATATFTPTAVGTVDLEFSTAPAAFSANTVYHIVIEHSSGTVNASNNASIQYNSGGDPNGDIRGQFAVATDTGGGWATTGGDDQGVYDILYAGGEYQNQGHYDSDSDVVWGTNHQSMRFYLPAPAWANGCGLRLAKVGSPSDLKLGIVDTDGTYLETITVPAALIGTSEVNMEFGFNSPILIQAQTTCRLVVSTADENEASAANGYTVYRVKAIHADWSYGGAHNQYGTASADAGPWTDTDTEDPCMWLVLETFDPTAASYLNTVEEVLDFGNWQETAWSPRVADLAEFRTFVAGLLKRANGHLKHRVGSSHYTSILGSSDAGQLKEAEMHYTQFLLLTSAAIIAETSDQDETSPWLGSGDQLRGASRDCLQQFERIILPYDTQRGRPGRLGAYAKAVSTTGRVSTVFDRDDGKVTS